MSSVGFILTPVSTKVFKLFHRELESNNCLDPTNFYPRFLKYLSFLTQLFTTFASSFRMGGSYFPINQHEKDKKLWLEILIGV